MKALMSMEKNRNRPRKTRGKVKLEVDRKISENDFSRMVKEARELLYETSVQFHRDEKIPCTYFYYTRVERGQVPNIDLALALIDKLGINERKGLFAWARSQMPTQNSRAIFADLEDKPARSSEQESVHRSMVLNRMQAGLLESDPVFWELLVYTSCYFEVEEVTTAKVAKDFGMPVKKIKELMDQLFDFGLLDKPKSGVYLAKEWIYIPQTAEFDKIRDKNFIRATKQFWKQPKGERFRTTITRLLNEHQIKQIEYKLSALQNNIIDMNEGEAEECRPHTIGVYFSERRFGDA